MSAAPVLALSSETESARSAEGFWPHDVVTPQVERRAVDASRLRFNWRDVVLIGGAAGAMWAAQWGLRSDVRDILTTMAGQQALDVEKARLQDERLTNLRDAIADMRRRQELQQYEIQGLKEIVIKMEGTRK